MNASTNACRRWREEIDLSVFDALPAGQLAALEQHLAACAECQRHAREMRAIGENLRRLGNEPVEPTPHFRRRWMAAVRSAHSDAPAPLDALRAFLLRHRRPLLALAPVWLLILLFKFTAPPVVPSAEPALARSPAEILQMLKSPMLLAGPEDHGVPRPVTPRRRGDGEPDNPQASSSSSLFS